jgi:hypothetical protein
MTWNNVMETLHLQSDEAEVVTEQSIWLGWDGWVNINDMENPALTIKSRQAKTCSNSQ